MKKVVGVYVGIVFSAFLLAPATNAKQDDLFSLSIEELLQVETDVAGFTSESIANSPSVVTVFSQQDIADYGVENVYDLMNFVPGFQATTGEKVGAQTKLQSRGVFLDNGYVLVMIDGVKLNEVSFGKASVYTPFIDLTNAEKVEIIRGPGSAVYGSNAFLGVINIVTKKDDHIKLGLSNDNGQRFSFGLTEDLFDGKFAASFMANKGNGADYDLMDYKSKQMVSTNKPYNHQQLSVSWANQSVELGYRQDEHQYDGFINLNGYHQDNYYHLENQYWYGKFSHKINQKLAFKGQLDFADHLIESSGFITSADIAPFSHDVLQGPYWGTQRLALQTSVNYQYSPVLTFSAGFEFQQNEQDLAGVVTSHIRSDGQSAQPAIDSNYVGLVRYSQLGDFEALLQTIRSRAWFGEGQWQISPDQRLYFGGRYETYSTAGDAFSPRISYVHKLNDKHQFKANYSQAFRAPVTNELYSNDGITLGNANLKPELIKTSELQWLMSHQMFSLESTFFHTELSDLIVNRPIAGSDKTSFFNDESDAVTGLEFLATADIYHNIRARATYSHYLSDTINGQYDNFATASLFWSAGKWRSNLHFIFRPKSHGKNSFVNGQQQIFSEQAQTIVNLALQYQMGKNLTLAFSGNNMFDKRYQAFEPRQNLNDYGVPQPGRSLVVSAKYTF